MVKKLYYECVGCGSKFYNEYRLNKHQTHCMYYGCEINQIKRENSK